MLSLQLKGLMGDRLKTMVGTTYEIFDNKIANVFNKFKWCCVCIICFCVNCKYYGYQKITPFEI